MVTTQSWQPLSQRLGALGDRSEKCFELWATQHGVSFAEFGLHRPPFDKFQYLPEQIRYLPDYIVEDNLGKTVRSHHLSTTPLHLLVEVKACGKDQIIKIRESSLDVLTAAEQHFQRPVVFFVFDSSKHQVSISLSLKELQRLVDADALPRRMFREGKRYFALPTSYLQWEPAPEGA